MDLRPRPRRDWAERFGANVVTTPEQARAEIDRLTDGLGADVAVEAVGIPETFEQCTELIRPGGRVATWACTVSLRRCTLSRSGSRASPSPPAWWIRSRPDPAQDRGGRADRSDPVHHHHHFPLHDGIQAYDTFARADETNALKVLLTAED